MDSNPLKLSKAQLEMLKDLSAVPMYRNFENRSIKLLLKYGLVKSIIRPASGDRINEYWQTTEDGRNYIKGMKI